MWEKLHFIIVYVVSNKALCMRGNLGEKYEVVHIKVMFSTKIEEKLYVNLELHFASSLKMDLFKTLKNANLLCLRKKSVSHNRLIESPVTPSSYIAFLYET